jgi:hypothetical protein
MNSKRAAIILLSVVLTLGILLGVAMDRFILPDRSHPPFERKRRPDLVAHFTKELGLNEQQQAQLKILLEEIKTKHDSLRRATSPEFHKVRDEFQQNFSKILTNEQQTKFDNMIKRDKPRED